MTRHLRLRNAFIWLAASSMIVALAGCPTGERPTSRQPKQPAQQPPAPLATPTSGQVATTSPTTEPAKTAEPAKVKEPAAAKPEPGPAPTEEAAEKPRELGPPLVDNVSSLKPLQPESLVWLDTQNRQVVFLGEVCRADYPLEFFVTYRAKSYESIIASDVKPWLVHTALLALGAEAGHPVRFQPEFVPPAGTEVAIERPLEGRRGQGAFRARSRLGSQRQDEAAAGHELGVRGKRFGDRRRDERGTLPGRRRRLHLPAQPCRAPRSTCRSAAPRKLESRSFEAFLEHLPPAGTPVTVLLKPKVAKKETKP